MYSHYFPAKVAEWSFDELPNLKDFARKFVSDVYEMDITIYHMNGNTRTYSYITPQKFPPQTDIQDIFKEEGITEAFVEVVYKLNEEFLDRNIGYAFLKDGLLEIDEVSEERLPNKKGVKEDESHNDSKTD